MVLKGTVTTAKGDTLGAISLDVDAAAQLAKIRAMLEKYGNLEHEFKEIVRSLRKYNQAQFDLKGTGQYVPLSVAYKRWKDRKHAGKPILVLSGRLRDSVAKTGALSEQEQGDDEVVEVTGTSMEYGTKVPYAAAIQYGYEPNNLPARPFMFWDFGRLRLVDTILERNALLRMAEAAQNEA